MPGGRGASGAHYRHRWCSRWEGLLFGGAATGGAVAAVIQAAVEAFLKRGRGGRTSTPGAWRCRGRSLLLAGRRQLGGSCSFGIIVSSSRPRLTVWAEWGTAAAASPVNWSLQRCQGTVVVSRRDRVVIRSSGPAEAGQEPSMIAVAAPPGLIGQLGRGIGTGYGGLSSSSTTTLVHLRRRRSPSMSSTANSQIRHIVRVDGGVIRRPLERHLAARRGQLGAAAGIVVVFAVRRRRRRRWQPRLPVHLAPAQLLGRRRRRRRLRRRGQPTGHRMRRGVAASATSGSSSTTITEAGQARPAGACAAMWREVVRGNAVLRIERRPVDDDPSRHGSR